MVVGGLILQDLSSDNKNNDPKRRRHEEKTVLVLQWAAQTTVIRVRLMAHLRENFDRILVSADSGAAQGLAGFVQASESEMQLVQVEAEGSSITESLGVLLSYQKRRESWARRQNFAEIRARVLAI